MLFTPDKQQPYTRDLCRVYTGAAPRLRTVSEVYGPAVTRSWLEIQLRDLSEFAGVRDKLSIQQIADTASVIISEYSHFKVSELMHFFILFKSGRYGKFYGAVDGLVITEALREFSRQRTETLALYRRQEEERREARWSRDHDARVSRFKAALAVSNMTIPEWMYFTRRHPDLTLDDIADLGWLLRMTLESPLGRISFDRERSEYAAARALLG